MKSSFTRRAFVERAARNLLGVSALTGLPALPQFARGGKAAEFVDNTKLPGFGSAENCIYLFMAGGMSHLDTFDPKQGSEIMGTTGTLKTKIPGEPLADNLPELAKLRDKFAIVRSLGQKTGDHNQGSYLMRTSYSDRPDIRHPSLGPWASQLLGADNGDLPTSVNISPGSNHPGRGFLPPALSPLPILNPTKGVPYSQRYGGKSEEAQARARTEYDRRLELMNTLDTSFREKFTDPRIAAYTDLYNEALKFMDSKDLEIFDLTKEPEAVRSRYGESSFAQGCLLAKRLVKSGIRFVDVQKGAWDTHADNFNLTSTLANDMDNAVSNLLQDLEAEGLLSKTLVVIATEFGRSPVINANEGRDHHPGVFSCVLAGAGITGGASYGESDEKGDRPKTDPIEPADFNATIAHAMGMNVNEIIKSPSGRPFTVASHTTLPDGTIISGGRVISDLFAG